jgi:hypothetical protein
LGLFVSSPLYVSNFVSTTQCVTKLDITFQVAGVTTAPADQLLDRWAELLLIGQQDTDPAADAWEALVTMLAQGRRSAVATMAPKIVPASSSPPSESTSRPTVAVA